MSNTPTIFPKLLKENSISSPRPGSSTKILAKPMVLTNIPNFNILAQKETYSPSILLNGDESPIKGNQSTGVYESKLDFKSPKSLKLPMNPKTTALLNLLASERQPDIVHNGNTRRKSIYVAKNNSDVDNLNREQKIIYKVETMIKIKGLNKCTQEKKLENRLDMISVPNSYYMGASKSPQETDTTRGTPRSYASYQEETGGFSQAVRSAETMESREENVQVSMKPGHDRRKSLFSKNFLDSPKAADNIMMDVEERRKSATLATSPINTKEFEIRELYRQLKENAIQKFGADIFKNAEKKLKDPEERKRIEKKRQDEIIEMRKLQEELGCGSIGRTLMKNLIQIDKKENDLQNEVPDKFSDYIEEEMNQANKVRVPPIIVIPAEAEDHIEEKVEEDVDFDFNQKKKRLQISCRLQNEKQQKSEEPSPFLSDSGKRKSFLSEGCPTPVLSSRTPKKLLTPNSSDNEIPSPFLTLYQKNSSYVTPKSSAFRSSLKLDIEDYVESGEVETPKNEKSCNFLPDIRKKGRASILVASPTMHQELLKKKSKAANSAIMHKNQIASICNDLENLQTNNDVKKGRASLRLMRDSYPSIVDKEEKIDSLKMETPKSSNPKSKLKSYLAFKVAPTRDSE